MKLLLCTKCQDIVRPLIVEERKCFCGTCSIIGLSDNITIKYSGESAIIIGFNNSSLVNAVRNQPENGMGKDFIAFVIPKQCISVKKI